MLGTERAASAGTSEQASLALSVCRSSDDGMVQGIAGFCACARAVRW